MTLGKTGGVCSVFAKARRLPVNVNGEFERNTKIVAENFDTKKPQTELTEWGYRGMLQKDYWLVIRGSVTYLLGLKCYVVLHLVNGVLLLQIQGTLGIHIAYWNLLYLRSTRNMGIQTALGAALCIYG